jgi:hypothetical protein
MVLSWAQGAEQLMPQQLHLFSKNSDSVLPKQAIISIKNQDFLVYQEFPVITEILKLPLKKAIKEQLSQLKCSDMK